MEIKRLNDNQIRCALTEEEIEEMGFSIDDIIGNSETTQKFMRVVLNLVEEQEQIDMDSISPMVKAELLQDHSMAITFGGDSDHNFRNLVDTVNHLMSQINPEKLEEFHHMSKEERKNTIDEFLKDFGGSIRNQETKGNTGKTKKSEKSEKDSPDKESFETETAEEEIFRTSMPFSLEFSRLEDAIRMAGLFVGAERVPQSSFYKYEDKYYLMMDFIHFSKEEIRPLAFAAVEYDKAHFSDPARVAFIQEHGKCMMKNEALQMLMQL